MHLLVRESRSLDEEQGAVDLGHAPADIVFLSFSDSDLGASAVAWETMGRPSLRLASLALLRHPMSVDLYVERVIGRARAVVVRLLGGLDYWRYGAEETFQCCRAAGIALAILPGDERDDARLTGLSTVPEKALTRLAAYFREGGPNNVAAALRLAATLGGIGGHPADDPPVPLPRAGEHPLQVAAEGPTGRAAIVFYRSHLLAGDVAPVTALAEALAARGLGVRAWFAASLKEADAGAFVADRLRTWRPGAVLNLTGFSAARDGGGSPLDAPGAPVLQGVLAGGPRAAWEASKRGLSPADLAMQVVLPELDGRLLTTALSFKAESPALDGLGFRPVAHAPEAAGIALAADRAAGWARLAATPAAERRIALVLSDYPGAGGGQIGHAIGLDTFASADEILHLLAGAGYRCGSVAAGVPEPRATLSLGRYRLLFAGLPSAVRRSVTERWGEPEADPSAANGAFLLRYEMAGNAVVAVQPGRGEAAARKAAYHDPDQPPRHAYLAFYLWLRHALGVHALAHLGAHGTLEWLPGKAVAVSPDCFPVALLGGLPVIYPFIVNNPGEAAAAKRRLGAVTIGHLTPPLRRAGLPVAAEPLERLIDEYAAADGLDRRRTALLRGQILELAAASGLLAESGVAPHATADEALARLDAYLCDVKDLQIRDGLHVFGRDPAPERRAAMLAAMPGVDPAALDASAAAERAALLAALDGRFVPPGPAGAPTRGRTDVLPTGRNLFSVDPRAIPTRSALALAERAAEELLLRHRQDHGDWPRTLVLDLWGSTTMRTGGEDLALALVLLGVRPVWDGGSTRVGGFEIVPLALLDRPRIDVTLRISGLFRDAFEAQVMLFDAAVRAVAARDETGAWNPLAAAARGLSGAALRRATARVYGPAAGTYGAALDLGAPGAAYLAGSAFAYGKELDGAADAAGFASRVAGADGLVHHQDHRETDLLESAEHAAHEGGFAAAAAGLGATPALYHLDTSRPVAPRARTVGEELALVVRGRAANPVWIAGMMRHGYRGAAEIARTVDALHGFAATLPERLDRQLDLLFEATLGDAAVDAFLAEANPEARAAMRARFRDALERGLWRPRRNSASKALA